MREGGGIKVGGPFPYDLVPSFRAADQGHGQGTDSEKREIVAALDLRGR